MTKALNDNSESKRGKFAEMKIVKIWIHLIFEHSSEKFGQMLRVLMEICV